MVTKFKKGQWVNNEMLNSTGCIISIIDDKYEIELTDGSKAFPNIDFIDRNFHLWTIEDAQDGDVIANDYGDIMIFRTIIDGSHIYGYVLYSQESNEIHIESSDFSNYHPATSEQCNLLWQKMREAGYKWDPFAKETIKSSFKLKETLFSASDRGIIDEIILALGSLGTEKMISYDREIKFLERIRKL